MINHYIYTSDIGLSFDLIVNNGIREPIATKKILSLLTSRQKNKTFKNKIFLDIGANIGYYTIVLSDFFEKIVCVEPSIMNLFLLKKNIWINRLDNKVKIIEGAIHYKKNKIYVVEEKALNLSYVSEYEGDYLVNTYTLKELFETYQPYLVKIDIEGFEYDLFFKSSDFKYIPPYLFIEIHFDKRSYKDNVKILKLFEKLGYRIKYAIMGRKRDYLFKK